MHTSYNWLSTARLYFKIVNVGIQSGGIETAVPEVISKENMDLLLMFSDKSDEILDSYTLVGDTLNNHENKL